MLGSLRLLLALAVAASHVDYRIAGLNPGVSAVVGFYLISGYVMAGLLQRHYPTPAQAAGFYADRAVRLMPQYLFYALLTLLWYRLTPQLPDNASLRYFLQAAASPVEYFNNLLVVPLNYYMWNGSDRFTLIPPAWSLGAEIQFYLLAPFLLGVAQRWCGLLRPLFLLTLGLAVCAVALALAAKINSDWFGYRLLPGVLTYFFLGAILYHLQQVQRPVWHLLVPVLCLALVAAWLAHRHGSLQHPYNQEVLLGLVLVLPLLCLLARRRRTRWDDLAGDISYGVFLNHFFIFWAIFPQGVPLSRLPVFLALCIGLAWLSQRWIERPCLGWRQRWRRGKSPSIMSLG